MMITNTYNIIQNYNSDTPIPESSKKNLVLKEVDFCPSLMLQFVSELVSLTDSNKLLSEQLKTFRLF